MDEKDKMIVVTKCNRCGKEFKFKVFPEDLQRYRDGGVLIQDAFPYLSPDMRELLITGVCPECWDKMFNEYE